MTTSLATLEPLTTGLLLEPLGPGSLPQSYGSYVGMYVSPCLAGTYESPDLPPPLGMYVSVGLFVLVFGTYESVGFLGCCGLLPNWA